MRKCYGQFPQTEGFPCNLCSDLGDCEKTAMRKFEDSLEYQVNNNGKIILFIDLYNLVKKTSYTEVEVAIKYRYDNRPNPIWETRCFVVDDDFTKEEFAAICERYNIPHEWYFMDTKK